MSGIFRSYNVKQENIKKENISDVEEEYSYDDEPERYMASCGGGRIVFNNGDIIEHYRDNNGYLKNRIIAKVPLEQVDIYARLNKDEILNKLSGNDMIIKK